MQHAQMVDVTGDGGANRNWLLPVLALLFLFSGSSALMYQVLWLRVLGLIFGVTVWAASIVLAVFMAGLALGSLAAGRFADRAPNPLLWFALVELLIGLSAAATPLALGSVEQLYINLYPTLSVNGGMLTSLRLGLASLVLIVPTMLMGASLPIVVKSSLVGGNGLGQRVSLLYASNTAGACAGTAIAGFFLIGQVGIRNSFGLAATLNLIVAVTAVATWFAFRRAPEARGAAQPGAGPGSPSPGVIPMASRRSVLAVFALTGFVALALEVIWFRLLVSFVEVTTYAFAVMLVAVLGGIAAGSALLSPLLRRQLPWLPLLAGVVLGTGLVSLLSVTILTYTFDSLISVLAPGGPLSPSQLLLAVVVSFLAIFPATLLMGIAFPLGLHLWATVGSAQPSQAGTRVGVFYALNVCGAVLGALAAGFLLLPTLGSRSSLIAVASVSMAAGLLLLSARPRLRISLLVTVGGGAVALFLLFAGTMPAPLDRALQRRFPKQTAVHREEGLQTTVAVLRDTTGWQSLYVDGIAQASDEPTGNNDQRLMGLLPLALHSHPREVLVLGLGGGTTAGAASLLPGAHVTVVELSPSVVRAEAWFRNVNYDVLHRRNVTLHIDDARNYLLLTPRRFDVIISSVVRPYHASSTNLFSVEFFQLLAKVLNDDGLVLQWNGGLTVPQYRLILRTFLRVFPETSLWAGRTVMIGGKQPLQASADSFSRQLQDPIWREAMAAVGLPNYRSLMARQWTGSEELHQYVGTGPILTDDQPQVEYFLSLPSR